MILRHVIQKKGLVTLGVALTVMGSIWADFGYYENFSPSWESQTGYTVQEWGLHAVDGGEPGQPLTADNGYSNPYAAPTAVWESDETSGFYGWGETAMGTHPDWVDENWGGMFQMAGGSATMTATVNPGTEYGVLKVWVAYDWYNYPGAGISASIDGATEITPESYYSFELGEGSSGPWYRTIQVFEFSENPDAAFDIVFTGTGFASMVDSFEITTAVGSDVIVPDAMPVPEPTTMGLLATGAVSLLHRRKRNAI